MGLLQHDPSIDVPPFPGQPAPLFGRGPSFQSGVPAPGGLGAGSSHHPTAAFPADAYGSSLGSERPKKVLRCSDIDTHLFLFIKWILISAPFLFLLGCSS